MCIKYPSMTSPLVAQIYANVPPVTLMGHSSQEGNLALLMKKNLAKKVFLKLLLVYYNKFGTLFSLFCQL